jgi:uncharacterized protein involved in outer membrane biogenesis
VARADGGPAERLFEEAEGVLHGEAPQVPAPQHAQVGWERAANPGQPQGPRWQLLLRETFNLDAHDAERGIRRAGYVEICPGIDLDFTARNWALPIGAPIPVSDIRLKGVWSGSEIVVPEFEADAAEGKVNGTLRVNWEKGVRLESDLSLARLNSKELIAAFTKDIAVTGKLEGNFSFVAEGPSLEELFTATKAQGKFRVGEGTVSNVDLVAVMQSDAAGTRAGVTKFAELTGEMSSSNRTASYRNINLQGGVLRGNGAVDVGANSNLSGRLNLEIRSQVAQDRGTFAISGTVGRPIIRRGG